MCRFKQLYGCAALAFGLGLLIGAWIEGGFWCTCVACGLVVAGIVLIKK